MVSHNESAQLFFQMIVKNPESSLNNPFQQVI